MTMLVETGTMVVPGDVIYSALLQQYQDDKCNSAKLHDSHDVTPALGCYVRITSENKTNCSNATTITANDTREVNTGAVYNIIASRSGVVQ